MYCQISHIFFFATSAEAEYQCNCTDYYNTGDEYSLCWNTPRLTIDWALVDGKAPYVYEKDTDCFAYADAPAFDKMRAADVTYRATND